MAQIQRVAVLYPAWQGEYQEALLEFDPEKLEHCVQAAEDACRKRLQFISKDPSCEIERLAIEDAFFALTELMRH